VKSSVKASENSLALYYNLHDFYGIHPVHELSTRHKSLIIIAKKTKKIKNKQKTKIGYLSAPAQPIHSLLPFREKKRRMIRSILP